MSGRVRPLTQQEITQRDATEGRQWAGIDVLKKNEVAHCAASRCIWEFIAGFISAGFFRKLFGSWLY
jgi:hypothetical protein